jgi:hypothetical protein
MTLNRMKKMFWQCQHFCKNVTVKHLIGDGKSLGGKNSDGFMVFNTTFKNISVHHGGQFYWWRKL